MVHVFWLPQSWDSNFACNQFHHWTSYTGYQIYNQKNRVRSPPNHVTFVNLNMFAAKISSWSETAVRYSVTTTLSSVGWKAGKGTQILKVCAREKPKQLTSSISDNLVTSGHMVDRATSFTAICIYQNERLLNLAESSAIALERPILSKQKELRTRLRLTTRNKQCRMK